MKKPRFSIALKLGIIIFCSSLCLCGIVIWFAKTYYTTHLFEVAKEIQKEVIQGKSSDLGHLLEGYSNTIYSLLANKDYRAYMNRLADKEQSTLNPQPQAETTNQLLTLFRNEFFNTKEFISYQLFLDNGEQIQYNRKNPIVLDHVEQVILPEMRQNFEKTTQTIMFSGTSSVSQQQDPLFYIAIHVWELQEQKHLGILVITAELSALENILLQESNQYIHFAVKDFEHRIIATCHFFHREDISLFSQAEKQAQIWQYSQMKTRVYSILDESKILEEMGAYQNRIVQLIVLITGVYILVMVAILIRFGKNSQSIVRAINGSHEADFESLMHIKSNDELQIIAEAFDEMMKRLALEKIEKATKHREMLEVLDAQRKAEINVLESQINSHFLANTLNVISFCAIEGDQAKVVKLIKDLSRTLQYTFDKTRKPVCVQDEVRWLEMYLNLQKERFGKCFDYQIQVEPGVEFDRIRKLLVQPFVENSILHGFLGISYGGVLKISFRRYSQNRLVITIQDNGVGMDWEKLASIRSLFRVREVSKNLGIGMENVLFRILLYYGKEAKIYIFSQVKMGTKIQILLPDLDQSIQNTIKEKEKTDVC